MKKSLTTTDTQRTTILTILIDISVLFIHFKIELFKAIQISITTKLLPNQK